ncbi:hypothetical protein H9655_08915 [Cytobacillus sp. Sa5YUA1]|uniref:DUF975 family protein n=1 Tax=Cytobacillus stercorigallinarum TaxID=2762240 RepID=A0ABR8QNP3_9BACI|nr:hypothetical protein [Cytobacillus stercorigallinarum]MBD7937151.1 hypothetical protein [Cytobacillus stercorigallinarum]
MEKNQKLIENARGLLALKKKKSFSLFRSSLYLFKLSWTRLITIGIVGLILFNFILFVLFKQISAVNLILEITNKLNAIIIPIFTVLITGYAIFQALANGNTLIRMISVKHVDTDNQKLENLSKFGVYNLYFYGLSIFYLSLIILNYLLSVSLVMVNEDWSFSSFSATQNEIICSLAITIYLMVVLNFLIEIKSFIFNLFQIFITNGVNEITKYLEEKDSEK